MRVLGVGAHPDDLEILCGGTLARYVEERHDVVMCHATKGDRGSFEYTSEEVARIRHGEAGRAAEIAGAEHVSLGLSDGEVDASDPAQRRLVVDLVRDTRPDVIITHSTGDYMADHNEISKLVFDSSFLSSLPLYDTGKPYHSVVPPIYFMETVMGLGFRPTEFVDVTGTMDKKVRMLE
ncbi:MAG: PIG-L deacetylase family protein, partial [Gaiellaceae bacterium]